MRANLPLHRDSSNSKYKANRCAGHFAAFCSLSWLEWRWTSKHLSPDKETKTQNMKWQVSGARKYFKKTTNIYDEKNFLRCRSDFHFHLWHQSQSVQTTWTKHHSIQTKVGDMNDKRCSLWFNQTKLFGLKLLTHIMFQNLRLVKCSIKQCNTQWTR